ncbi:RlpA-like double-psi beta-barrel-protein domain-containing protein-containing protein [Pterulicium gracile]|uniref:RlpA-like double-psi beta-barrel-protein domain-containing protein-containing protein n=1 Tax=Pterulicium gracile TaxID=1884261 RepID=A0A5C3QED6_9AGAR|nr:RlpA-like double-psi beta-barrel-protein domain-containing protein-containing protein [Pterula gracilis]
MKFATAAISLFASAAAVYAAALARREVGSGTHFDVAVGYTACGTLHSNDQFLVAASAPLYDSTAIDGNPNNNQICGRQISISGPAGGPVIATVVDRCPVCAQNDMDMTPSLFQAVVGDLGIGRAEISWNWV